MTSSSVYRMPTGILTNEKQLKQLQAKMLREASLQNKGNSPTPKITSKNYQGTQNNNNIFNNPETTTLILSQMQNNKNAKQHQIKIQLAKQLKQQMQQKQVKRRSSMESKLYQEKSEHEKNSDIVQRQIENKRIIREKMHKEMAQNYTQWTNKMQEKKRFELEQKQKTRQKLKRIQEEEKQREINLRREKFQNHPNHQRSQSMKFSNYYKDVANFQQDNYQNFNSYKTNSNVDSLQKNTDDLIKKRLQQNQSKLQQIDNLNQSRIKNQKQQLQKILQNQIKDSQKRKEQQKAYYNNLKFYDDKFQSIYHPICNPIDSKFCKDNKYIINELYSQGRQTSMNVQNSQSVLARKGSRTLL